MYCTNCGNKLSEDAVFCTRCGEKTEKIEKTVICTKKNKLKKVLWILPCVIIVMIVSGIFFAKNLFPDNKNDSEVNADKNVETEELKDDLLIEEGSVSEGNLEQEREKKQYYITKKTVYSNETIESIDEYDEA